MSSTPNFEQEDLASIPSVVECVQPDSSSISTPQEQTCKREKISTYRVGPWEIKCLESHILHSQCTKEGKCANSSFNSCQYCVYRNSLPLARLPDMLFPNNCLTLTHDNGFGLKFTAFDALNRVCNSDSICVSRVAEKEDSGLHSEAVRLSNEWTFSTDYTGTIFGGLNCEVTDEKIDYDMLRRRDEMLFYRYVSLFEDELHDKGSVECSVKIRVMPSYYFVLLRYFLRVDNLLLRSNETRMLHEYGRPFILKEYCTKEVECKDMPLHPSQLTDPDVVTQLMPVLETVSEKIVFPETSCREL